MADFIPSSSKNYIQQENAKLKQENEELKSEVKSLRQFVESLDSIYNAADNFEDDSKVFSFIKGTLANDMKLVNAPDG
jgi:cell division septum initiation protein DivIVA